MTPAFVDDDSTSFGPRCPPPFSTLLPPPVYRARLNELEGCHLEITCACGNRDNKAIVALIRNFGGPLQSFGGMLRRLRCSKCRQQPATVLLNEVALKHAAYGPPVGWSVKVWPMMSLNGETP